MKYSVGDRIVIRDDLELDNIYGGALFNREMEYLLGLGVTIQDVSSNMYIIDLWYVTDEMIDHSTTSKANSMDSTSGEENVFDYSNKEEKKTYLSWEVIKELTECNNKRFKNLKTKLIVGGSNKISDIMFFDDEWVEVGLKSIEFIDAFALFRTYSTDMVCFYNGEYIYFVGDEDTEYSFLESWIDYGEWFVVK